MILITDEGIAAAEAEHATAAERRREVERKFARGTLTTRSHDELYEAKLAADHAAARLSVLRAEYAEQQAAREAREAAGRAAAQELAPTARQLDASREKAVRAVAAADRAMAAALAAVDAHDQAVRAASAELRQRGLRADDGEATGGARDGSVRLDGSAWHPLDAPSLLGAVLGKATAATHPRHPLGRNAWPVHFGGPAAAKGRALLLASLPSAPRSAA